MNRIIIIIQIIDGILIFGLSKIFVTLLFVILGKMGQTFLVRIKNIFYGNIIIRNHFSYSFSKRTGIMDPKNVL